MLTWTVIGITLMVVSMINFLGTILSVLNMDYYIKKVIFRTLFSIILGITSLYFLFASPRAYLTYYGISTMFSFFAFILNIYVINDILVFVKRKR